MTKPAEFLRQSVDPSGLGLFRILFGIVLSFQAIEFINRDFVQKELIDPVIHYPFPGFDFLPIFSAGLLQAFLIIMAIAGLVIAAGYFQRIALSLYFLLFTYFWLIDRGYFNNHYYFISILCAIMAMLETGAWNPFRKGRHEAGASIPAWQPFALKVMVLIVFTWAAINKMQAGWLINHQPVAHILEVKAATTGNAAWDSSFLAVFLTWGGMLFDLLVIPLLWWKKTRKYAFVGMIIFNLFNFYLFRDIGEIGIFPWLVLATTALFASPDIGRRIHARIRGKQKEKGASKKKKKQQAPAPLPESKPDFRVYLLGAFLFFQVIYPARHLLYPGHVDWTGEGQRFAWRMKIVYKDFDMHFYTVANGGQGQRYETTLGKMLTPRQYTALGYYPDLIPPTARFIKAQAVASGIPDPVIQVSFVSGLNGGPRQELLDPTLDASKLTVPFLGHCDWIKPYKGS